MRLWSLLLLPLLTAAQDSTLRQSIIANTQDAPAALADNSLHLLHNLDRYRFDATSAPNEMPKICPTSFSDCQFFEWGGDGYTYGFPPTVSSYVEGVITLCATLLAFGVISLLICTGFCSARCFCDSCGGRRATKLYHRMHRNWLAVAMVILLVPAVVLGGFGMSANAAISSSFDSLLLQVDSFVEYVTITFGGVVNRVGYLTAQSEIWLGVLQRNVDQLPSSSDIADFSQCINGMVGAPFTNASAFLALVAALSVVPYGTVGSVTNGSLVYNLSDIVTYSTSIAASAGPLANLKFVRPLLSDVDFPLLVGTLPNMASNASAYQPAYTAVDPTIGTSLVTRASAPAFNVVPSLANNIATATSILTNSGFSALLSDTNAQLAAASPDTDLLEALLEALRANATALSNSNTVASDLSSLATPLTTIFVNFVNVPSQLTALSTAFSSGAWSPSTRSTVATALQTLRDVTIIAAGLPPSAIAALQRFPPALVSNFVASSAALAASNIDIQTSELDEMDAWSARLLQLGCVYTMLTELITVNNTLSHLPPALNAIFSPYAVDHVTLLQPGTNTAGNATSGASELVDMAEESMRALRDSLTASNWTAPAALASLSTAFSDLRTALSLLPSLGAASGQLAALQSSTAQPRAAVLRLDDLIANISSSAAAHQSALTTVTPPVTALVSAAGVLRSTASTQTFYNSLNSNLGANGGLVNNIDNLLTALQNSVPMDTTTKTNVQNALSGIQSATTTVGISTLVAVNDAVAQANEYRSNAAAVVSAHGSLSTVSQSLSNFAVTSSSSTVSAIDNVRSLAQSSSALSFFDEAATNPSAGIDAVIALTQEPDGELNADLLRGFVSGLAPLTSAWRGSLASVPGALALSDLASLTQTEADAAVAGLQVYGDFRDSLPNITDMRAVITDLSSSLSNISLVLRSSRNDYYTYRNQVSINVVTYDVIRLLVGHIMLMLPTFFILLALAGFVLHLKQCSMVLALLTFPMMAVFFVLAGVQGLVAVLSSDHCVNTDQWLISQLQGHAYSTTELAPYLTVNSSVQEAEVFEYLISCQNGPSTYGPAPELFSVLADPQKLLRDRHLNFNDLLADAQATPGFVAIGDLERPLTLLASYGDQLAVQINLTTQDIFTCPTWSSQYTAVKGALCDHFAPQIAFITVVYVFLAICISPGAVLGAKAYKRIDRDNDSTTTNPQFINNYGRYVYTDVLIEGQQVQDFNYFNEIVAPGQRSRRNSRQVGDSGRRASVVGGSPQQRRASIAGGSPQQRRPSIGGGGSPQQQQRRPSIGGAGNSPPQQQPRRGSIAGGSPQQRRASIGGGGSPQQQQRRPSIATASGQQRRGSLAAHHSMASHQAMAAAATALAEAEAAKNAGSPSSAGASPHQRRGSLSSPQKGHSSLSPLHSGPSARRASFSNSNATLSAVASANRPGSRRGSVDVGRARRNSAAPQPVAPQDVEISI